MTHYGSHFLVIVKEYALTTILSFSQLKGPAWAVLHYHVPSLHPRLPTWAPAGLLLLCWEGSWLGLSLPCSDMQGTEQQLVSQCPPRGVFAAQQSPVTPLRQQGHVLGFSFQLQAPLPCPLCETKVERAARAVRRVSYDPISPVYELMIQGSGVGSSGAARLVLTSSCRTAAGGSSTREAKGWQLSGEQSKVTCQVSCS